MSRAALLAAALLVAPAPSEAIELGLFAEATGNATWRVALGGDTRAPGFDVQAGGLDALVGLEIGGFAAVLAGAHWRSGRGARVDYLELAGDLAGQLLVAERVRLRFGATVGRAFVDGRRAAALLAGGFVATSFDLRALASGHFALVFAIRLDLGAYPGGGTDFPDGTLALGAGFGGRY